MRMGVVLISLALAVGQAFAATPPKAVPPLAPSGPLTIVIYDQPDFKGRSTTLTQPTPDLASLAFDDKVASFKVTGAGDWVLCENRNYTGRCMRVQAEAGDLTQLRMVGRVSSLYPAPPAK